MIDQKYCIKRITVGNKILATCTTGGNKIFPLLIGNEIGQNSTSPNDLRFAIYCTLDFELSIVAGKGKNWLMTVCLDGNG